MKNIISYQKKSLGQITSLIRKQRINFDAIDQETKAAEEIETYKTYSCYIKSHCEHPDFEEYISARNKDEAIEKFLKETNLGRDWDKESLERYVHPYDNRN